MSSLPSRRVTTHATWPEVALAVTVGASGALPGGDLHHVMLFRGDATLGTAHISRGDIVFRSAVPERDVRAPQPFEIVHAMLAPRPELAVRDPGIYKLVDPMISSLLGYLEEAARRGAASDDRAVSGSAELLGLRLVELLPRAAPASARGGLSATVLRRVCEHIDDQLAQPIRLAELARIADLSRAHFARSFKAATGESPQRFVRRRRIQRAQELLHRSDMPLVEIALETGFTSQSLFTTTFSGLVGQSPGRFRRHRAEAG